jgi:hypothetical protein
MRGEDAAGEVFGCILHGHGAYREKDFFTMGSIVFTYGNPYAGNLHVRFDEGAGVSCGGAPLYSTPLGCQWRPY